jgi:hypothetical protein
MDNQEYHSIYNCQSQVSFKVRPGFCKKVVNWKDRSQGDKRMKYFEDEIYEKEELWISPLISLNQ